MRQNCNNSATLQDGIPQSPCSSFMEMKNGYFSKTSVYETNFTSKSTSLTPFLQDRYSAKFQKHLPSLKNGLLLKD